MGLLPTLFISHGAPTFALEPGKAGAALAHLAKRLGPVNAILMVSAHWETDEPAVSSATAPETIHDFFGFPEPLYRLRYPAPGSPALATRVTALLRAAGLPAREDHSQGLDHGAWVPLLHMWPRADVAVAQLSIQTRRGPEHHAAVGRALAPLAGEGVLVIGSGSITHNLREFRRLPEDAGEESYVGAFRRWFAEHTSAHDEAALLDYRQRAPEGARAHPTEDHILPFFVAMAAAGAGRRHERFHEGVNFGVIGMDAYVFGAERLPAGALAPA